MAQRTSTMLVNDLVGTGLEQIPLCAPPAGGPAYPAWTSGHSPHSSNVGRLRFIDLSQAASRD